MSVPDKTPIDTCWWNAWSGILYVKNSLITGKNIKQCLRDVEGGMVDFLFVV